MSPLPCRSMQPPLGMNRTIAPGVHVPGQDALAPVVGSAQCPSLARSPRGGAPAGGLALGRPLASGRPSGSGGDGWPVGQPAGNVLLLMVTLELPVLAKLVT